MQIEFMKFADGTRTLRLNNVEVAVVEGLSDDNASVLAAALHKGYERAYDQGLEDGKELD